MLKLCKYCNYSICLRQIVLIAPEMDSLWPHCNPQLINPAQPSLKCAKLISHLHPNPHMYWNVGKMGLKGLFSPFHVSNTQLWNETKKRCFNKKKYLLSFFVHETIGNF